MTSEYEQQLREADAAGSEIGLFILYKVAETGSIQKTEVHSNLKEPGLEALQKLVRAELIQEREDSYLVTSRGQEILAESLA